MPIEAASIVEDRRLSFAGDILWLGIAAGACALIVGIVCWSFSVELSTGAGSGRPNAAATPETSAGSAAVAPSPTFGINRIPTPGPSSTIGECVERWRTDELDHGADGAGRSQIVAPGPPCRSAANSGTRKTGRVVPAS